LHPLQQHPPAAALEREEGDAPLGQLPAAGGGAPVLALLNRWLYAAALRAPTRTEALLHLFLTHDANPSDALGAAPGSAAALRRSAELLGLCAAARRGSPMALLERTGEGMAALSRKQHYEGFVRGMAGGALGAGAGGARAIAAAAPARAPCPVSPRPSAPATDFLR